DGDGLFPAPTRELASLIVGETPRGDVNEPASRVVGQALTRPLVGGCDERFLYRIFRSTEVPESPDDRAEHLRRKFSQQGLDPRIVRIVPDAHVNSLGGALIPSRTSIGMFIGTPPLPGAAEARAAIS